MMLNPSTVMDGVMLLTACEQLNPHVMICPAATAPPTAMGVQDGAPHEPPVTLLTSTASRLRGPNGEENLNCATTALSRVSTMGVGVM